MNPNELIDFLRNNVIEKNLELYKMLLDTTKEATDETWKGILPIYNSLNEVQKSNFIKFLGLVEVNTLSHVLGILDGVSSTKDLKDELILISNSTEEKINGELQDIFLESEEN